MSIQSFGKYVVVNQLGRGGMAEVYLARDPMLDRQVAIKVIYPHLTADPAFEERFRREAKLVASLRHNHIVQLYDFDVQNNQPYMVMEFLNAGSLKTRLETWRADGKRMPLAEAARILEAIASALDYAHAQGAVHRDVKPANIMFTANNEPVLTDFGIAKIVGEAAQLSASGSVVGSPAYMSPEQAASKPVDAKSDIYALGVVLYEMTTGRVPFQGDSPTAVLMQHLNAPPPLPRQFNATIPEPIQAVILKALAKNPQDRFARAGDLARAFGAALRGQALPAPSVSTAAQTLVDQPASELSGVKPLSEPVELTAKRKRVLGHLGLLAEIFAPLVGRQAPEMQAQDRRSLIATVLGIVGILLAVLQLLASFFDLIQRPIAPLMSALPYLIVIAFIGGGVLSLYVLARSSSAANRKRAAIVLTAVVLVGVAWGAWTFYNRTRPVTSFIVLIADFKQEGSKRVDMAYAIERSILQDVGDQRDLITIERANVVVQDAPSARALAEERKATMVIWGKYDDTYVYPFVQVLKIPALARETVGVPVTLMTTADGLAAPRPSSLNDATQYSRTPVTISDISFQSKTEEQVANLSTALLGVAFYANGDSVRAKELIDKGLGRLEQTKSDIPGSEILYFQRANVRYSLGSVQEAANDLQTALKIKETFEGRYNLAIAYSELCTPARQLTRAIAEAERAVQLKPTLAATHRLLGDLYRQAGKYPQAINEFQAALKIDANDAQTYDWLASAQIASGKTADAEKSQQTAQDLWRKKLETMPANSVEAHLARGDVQMSIGDYPGALTDYQAAQSLAPKSAAAQRGIGNAYYQLHNLATATRAYEQSTKLAPNDANAHILLGLAYIEARQTVSATTELQRATALSACSTDAYIMLGNLYFEQDDLPKALGAYQSAANADPQNSGAYYLLGVTQYLLKQLDAAAKSLESSIALRGDFAPAHFALGSTYYYQGAYQKSATAREAAIQLAPDEPFYHESLAYAYDKLGRLDDAAAEYRQAIARKDNADTRAYLAMVLTRQKKFDAALAEFQQALKLNPQNDLAYIGLGDLYVQQAKWDDAVAAYRNALARNNDGLTRLQLANALVLQGKSDAAVVELQQAIAQNPQNAQVQMIAANTYKSLNRFDDALKAYRAVVASQANNVQAYYHIVDLEYKRCNLTAAAQAANSIVTLLPKDSTARNVLASVYEAQGRNDDAAKIYADLRNAAASDLDAHMAAGLYLYRAGNGADARREFQIILETAAPNTSARFISLAHYYLGQIDMEQDRLVPAETAFKNALTQWSSNAFAQQGLAEIALRRGDAATAIQMSDQAHALLPAFAQHSSDWADTLKVTLPALRGLALTRQNKRDDANAALTQALDQATRWASGMPQSPVTHFWLGYVHLVRGDKPKADAEFVTAIQCDQSLNSSRARIEMNLTKIK